MEAKEKTREEVMAEREARKKAKQAKKKPKTQNDLVNDVKNSSKTDSIMKMSAPDGSVESSAPTVNSKCTSGSESRKSTVDFVLKKQSPSSKIDSAKPNPIPKAVTDCATPGIPLNVKFLHDAPIVNDQIDGCILKERQAFSGVCQQDINLLSKEMKKASLHYIEGLETAPKPAITSSKTVVQVSPPVSSKPLESSGEPTKSKAELKAERRAKQEAQRAAKAVSKAAPVKTAPAKASPKPVEMKPAKSAIKRPTAKSDSEAKSKSVTFAGSSTKQASQNKIKLFSHLYREKSINYKSILNSIDLHPAVVGLGVQYSNRVIVGSNARCVALLYVLKQMLSDYKTPAEKEFSRGFEAKLEPAVNYLNQCRPVSVSMTNALKHIKWHLTQLPNNITDAEARLKMSHVITTYIKEQIEVAGEAISLFVRKKIANGDVILTFGCSSLVERILKEAHEAGVDFSVVIIDSAPWFEGKEMLRRLVKAKIPCTYVLISAASFIMKQASKVLLGAHALLANGCVMSRSGTAMVALLANTANVPVLVCCETHKFSERVQTDAFVYNELGDPNELVSTASPLNGWESNNFLVPLSLVYDVTPPDLVTAVVTELAILPCTSVPVVLRIKPTESSA
nr:PREDICTED: translation initiation factor eIF-2B subunit delta [Bemisia tabaci]